MNYRSMVGLTRTIIVVLGFLLTACNGVPTRPSAQTAPLPRTPDLAPGTATASTKSLAVDDIVLPVDAVAPIVDASQREATGSVNRVLQRLSAQLAGSSCEDPATLQATKTLLRKPSALAKKIERIAPMLDYVLTAVEEAQLPGEFALIPWAESDFRADPGNRGSVQGLWQFTEQTGRGHGLRIDRHYDGRRAAIQSTLAAVDHLTRLQARFDDWRVSVLAYNAGEYRVARGLKVRAANPNAMPTGLAAHSYAYLHKITAVSCVLRDLQAHNVVIESDQFPRMQQVARPPNIHSTEMLARASGIELTELWRYNAGFRNGEIADNAPVDILLPHPAAARLLALREQPTSAFIDESAAVASQDAKPAPTDSQPRSVSQHVVGAGENLWRIARRYRVALADLLRWNGLNSRSVIKPGQRLRLSEE